MKSYKLSVRLMTYNHGNYIEEALKGIDIQKTDFNFEVVVGDDFSTDDTLSRIRNYNFSNQNLHLRVLEREVGDSYYKERKKKGRLYNFVDILNNCTGDYIALLDGDDYWTDPLKLQKQVDFLKENEEFGICFHKVTQINDFNGKITILPNISENMIFKIEDYILNNRTATCSILFKKENLRNLPDWFSKLPFGDLGLVLIVMQNSNKKAGVLKDNMGVYRIHQGGIHGSLHRNKLHLIKAYEQHILFTKIISSHLLTQKEYKRYFYKKMANTYTLLAKFYKEEGLKRKFIKSKLYKDYYHIIKLNN